MFVSVSVLADLRLSQQMVHGEDQSGLLALRDCNPPYVGSAAFPTDAARVAGWLMSAARRKRPNCCGAIKWREAPFPDSAVQQEHFYSITSSARSRSAGGAARPISFAVLRLRTNSNFVGRSIGKSEGFAPRAIRWT